MLLLVTDTSGKDGTVCSRRVRESTICADAEVIEVAPLAGGTFSAQLVPQIAALLARAWPHQSRYRCFHRRLRPGIVYRSARRAGCNQGAGGDSAQADCAGFFAGTGSHGQSCPGQDCRRPWMAAAARFFSEHTNWSANQSAYCARNWCRGRSSYRWRESRPSLLRIWRWLLPRGTHGLSVSTGRAPHR